MWQNFKKKKFKCDKTQKPKLWQDSKNQIVKKLKTSNCDKTQEVKLWHNSKIQIMTKLKNKIVIKLKNSNCYKTQQLKCWPNLKAHIVKKLKNTNFDTTQKEVTVTNSIKNNWTPQQPMRCSWGSFFCNSRDVLICFKVFVTPKWLYPVVGHKIDNIRLLEYVQSLKNHLKCLIGFKVNQQRWK